LIDKATSAFTPWGPANRYPMASGPSALARSTDRAARRFQFPETMRH
jgi:hypothetical protein